MICGEGFAFCFVLVFLQKEKLSLFLSSIMSQKMYAWRGKNKNQGCFKTESRFHVSQLKQQEPASSKKLACQRELWKQPEIKLQIYSLF